MNSRARKFSAAFDITWDERAQLAEERMASVDRDDDAEEADDEIAALPSDDEEGEPHYAASVSSPVSADRWQSAQIRLPRNS